MATIPQPPQVAINEAVPTKSNESETDQKINTILSCILYDEKYKDVFNIPRFRLRLATTAAWSIPTGKRILDIGCGQGESTIVLASELGPSTHTTGVDTAPPDYGHPFTMSQSQDFLKKSIFGKRISFEQSDTASFLERQPLSPAFDAAVLCHSLWYFPSLQSVFSLFKSLAAAGISSIYVAEYCTEASHPSQIPHILAAEAQALLCKYQNNGEAAGLLRDELNVRAAPTVSSILEAAKNAGYSPSRQGRVTPGADFLEGHSECLIVQGQRFRNRVIEQKFPKDQEEVILSYVPRVKEAMNELKASGIEKVRSMDVWWAELKL
ncbi:Methyltransferase ustM [Cladobotryum mycophilum]|uniref:Methyltransferase ustM n=1 Tax=Cladobotryum mycophilum TaxID=491253 RepID=A0ABR0SI65_9HYPO